MEQKPENVLKYESRRIYVHHLSVDETYRGQSVDAKLLEEIMTLSKSTGIEAVALDTWSFNEQAYRFFRKHGFEAYNIRMWHTGADALPDVDSDVIKNLRSK